MLRVIFVILAKTKTLYDIIILYFPEFFNKVLTIFRIEGILIYRETAPQTTYSARTERRRYSMKKMRIMLDTIEDVKEFVAQTNKYSFDSDLVSGRYAVDAKSIMGIFSLDLSKVLEFVVHDDGAQADELLDAVMKFKA